MLPRWLYELLPWAYLLLCAVALPFASEHLLGTLSSLLLGGLALWILWIRHYWRLRDDPAARRKTHPAPLQFSRRDPV